MGLIYEKKPSGGTLSYITYLNKHCHIHNLISYFKVAVMRAFYEAILSYFLYQTFVLFSSTFSRASNKSLPASALASLLLFPLFIIFVICFIYVGFYVFVVCKKIVEILKTSEKDAFDMASFEKQIYATIKITHWIGVGLYTGIAITTALVFYFSYRLPVDSLLWLMGLSGIVGFVLGCLWNFTDWLSDNRIDWCYVIKGCNPMVAEQPDEMSEDKRNKLEAQKRSKFKFYRAHVIMLSISSFIVIGLAFFCFITGAEALKLDASFFGNAYIVFFSTVCLLFFRSCYVSYFKSEESTKKVYPHLTDFIFLDGDSENTIVK